MESIITRNIHLFQDKTITLNCFIDGASGINVSKGYSLWPVLLGINELQESYGNFDNLVLAAVFWGLGKPDFESFINPFANSLISLVDTGLTINSDNFKIKPCFLIADMVAKAAILKMSQFNG